MKTTITALATLSSLVLALPGTHEIKRTSELTTSTTIGTLTWTGPSTPAPPYNPWDFDDFRANMHAKGITQDIYESDFRSLTITPTTPNAAVMIKSKLNKREEPWFDCNAGADYAWGSKRIVVDCTDIVNDIEKIERACGKFGIGGGGDRYVKGRAVLSSWASM
ncbi:hypothetical protein QBC34DRAFT_429066 [Podospora aff. communis PSN243]|uniref:Ecp2 effector protein domain-containing protein n=1 Tax=Podospora aff. communis PSN243 TaxID=3040156 RepID=A0AAV9GDS9_9PEZI|nr:hypothetical protein QBC34DRAFT_429066 [Podospora aff. communis PSN243]